MNRHAFAWLPGFLMIAAVASLAVGLLDAPARPYALLSAAGLLIIAFVALIVAAVRGEHVDRYRELAESLPFGLWLADKAGRFTHFSDSYLRMLGMTLAQARRGEFLERMPVEDRDRFVAAWQRRSPGEPFEAGYRVTGADGKTYSVVSHGIALRDGSGKCTGWIGFSLDVTARQRAAEQMEFLAELSRVLSLTLNPAITLERTAALMVPRVSDWYAVDLLSDEGEVERVLMVHADPQQTRAARGLLACAPRELTFPSGAPLVIATGRPQVYANFPISAIAQLDQGDPQQVFLDSLKGTGIVVPLVARERTIGALTFLWCGRTRPIDADETLFAYLIARRVAIAY
ncbi:MAG: PAS domain S-box protein, partial [Candidatus Eremiobacteraeota bacterium]|nr:PAS domain S-box protein [Candidatus Eremiobacteraeota bacterium]